MSDFGDDAGRITEHDLEVALQNQAAQPRMKAIGQCYNCQETLSAGLFCDEDCREDYEKRTRR